MPRFVILIHDHPFLHWDFLLERGDTLRTWRLLQDPVGLCDSDSTLTISAEALPDHRRHYLDYEGPVSNNRGTVRRWDRGQYELQAETADTVHVLLQGEKLAGRVVLERDPSVEDRWAVRRS